MSNAFQKVMQERSDLVTLLLSQMEKGYFVTQASWDGAVFQPFNPVSQVSYRGGNRFKLMVISDLYHYRDPRWCTFKQSDSKGWRIKKGSHGVMLEKWIFTKEEPVLNNAGEAVRDVNGNKVVRQVPLDKPFVNYFRVFNAEQIDGIPEYRLPEIAKDDLYQLGTQIMQSSKCPIYLEPVDKAYYHPLEDAIHLPCREAFKTNEAFLSVLLHEMSHSTGHKTRLGRPMENSFGSPDYAKEELNAELGAFFMKSDLGIALKPDSEAVIDHADYIKSWMSLFQENPNELYIACANADKISAYLMDHYKKSLQKEIQEGKSQTGVQEEREKKKKIKGR